MFIYLIEFLINGVFQDFSPWLYFNIFLSCLGVIVDQYS